jgi:beta-lactamase class A
VSAKANVTINPAMLETIHRREKAVSRLLAAASCPTRFLARMVAVACLLLSFCPASSAAELARTRAEGLQQELDRLVAPFDGQVGVYVLDLHGGRAAFVNPDTGFPMASTVKVAVAVNILSLVDEGTLDLQQQVLLKEGDIYPEMGGPMDIHLTPGSAITVRDLLHMMLTVSDNNATDILIRLGGGTATVDARMRTLGVSGIRVDRYIWELLANYFGALDASAQNPLSPADYGRLGSAKRNEADRRHYRQIYNGDPRDTSTPAGMASLLRLVWQGKALKPETTAVLKSIMLDCRTGEGRLKGMLPDAAPVAHKTGSVGAVANDVGVITLPAGKGDIVVAVFVKSDRNDTVKDDMIAHVARAAYDYFVFVPAN